MTSDESTSRQGEATVHRPSSTVFVKLGGSLITDKAAPHTARPEVLHRLMREIAEARAARHGLQLVLGHGSGSFGHVEGRKYGTREGVRTPEDWRGFAEVQWAANQLNRLVVDAARAAGLSVVNLPPSASAVARDAVIETLALAPIENALAHDLIAVVQGDVAVDTARGGTIISTEDVFRYLAPRLQPQHILLAGIERGVLTRWPDGEVIPHISHKDDYDNISGAHTADVTGGMAAKVREALAMAASAPGGEVVIFSGETPGLVKRALLGESVPGTVISRQ